MELTDYNKRLIIIAIFLIYMVVIYSPITSLGFSQIDDPWMLLNDKFVYLSTFRPADLYKLFTTYNSLQYSPVNTLFYKLVYQINGYDPYWYHISCFSIHLFNGYLCYRFIHLIGKFLLIESVESVCCLTCFLWLIHPFNVESVVWISASKVLLYFMFGLLSLNNFLMFELTKKRRYYYFSVIFFILSCLSKEQAVILTALILTILIFRAYGNIKESLIVSISMILPFVIISILFSVVTWSAQQNAIGIDAPLSNYNFFTRFVLSFFCLCFYIFNGILPFDLHYNYEFPIKPGQSLPYHYFLFPPAFLFFVVVAIKSLKSRSDIRFYSLWAILFFINISLCVQIVPLKRPALMADRYMYFPLISILIIPCQSAANYLSQKFDVGSLRQIFVLGMMGAYCYYLATTSNELIYSWQKFNL